MIKKIKHSIVACILGVGFFMAAGDAVAQHAIGGNVGSGPRFGTGGGAVISATVEYKYFLLDEKLSIGGRAGLHHLAVTGAGANGMVAFTSHYFFNTNTWRPYAGLGIGGVFGSSSAFYLSPEGGVLWAFKDNLNFDFGIRVPVSIASFSSAGMTVNAGVYYRF